MRLKQTTLTPLPYAENALEPFLSSRTLKEHHGKHQQAYVDDWNRIEALRYGQRNRPQGQKGSMIRALYELQTFNGSGIILHEMYWQNLSPTRSTEGPSVALQQCMTRCFGSVSQCIADIIDVGLNIKGSGWVVLAWIPRFDRMMILPVNQHQNNWIPGAVPLIVIDVWEHAYYLDLASDRETYLTNIIYWLNWPVINHRFKVIS